MIHRDGLTYIAFRDGTTKDYIVPADPRDERYSRCTDHHPACDCREALHNEDFREIAMERERFIRKARAILAGHPIDECMCTGCQIAREHGGFGFAVCDSDGKVTAP